MSQAQDEVKKKRGRAKGIPLTSNLPPDDKLRIFVNLVIDRIKEEQSSGKLDHLLKKMEVKDA